MARLTKHLREDFSLGAPQVPPPDWLAGVILAAIVATVTLLAYAFLGW